MKSVAVYQGLFLIAIGLYAAEKTKVPLPSFLAHEKTECRDLTVLQSPELNDVYQKLKVSAVFSTPLDGLTLSHTLEEIKIELKSDELYEGDAMAMEETWLPVLDAVANVLFKGGEPKNIALAFASNATFEKDDFSFSSQRAEWVMRYFNRKYPLRLDQGNYRIEGMGKASDSNGKNIPTVQIFIRSGF